MRRRTVWSVFGGFRKTRGSVSLFASVSMSALIFATAIALDLANVYLVKSQDQRIADDQCAIDAAFVYGASNSLTTASNAAASLAVSNGSGDATVTTSLVNSPSGDGSSAIMVSVSSAVPLSGFGRAITKTASNPIGQTSLSVSAAAYAELHAGAPCIIAMNPAGLSETGGVSTTATSCSIAVNGSVTATSGAAITAKTINAVGSITASNGATITTVPASGQLFAGSSVPTDPFVGNGVFSRISTVSSLLAPLFPSVGNAPSGGASIACSGTVSVGPGSHGTISASSYPICNEIDFTGGGETDVSGSGIQNTGGNLVITMAAGTYKINGINPGQYGTVTITMSGNVTLYIWGGIVTAGSSTLTFNGTGTYYVQGGIVNGSSNALTFNNTNSSSPSTFYVAGGIIVNNGPGAFPNGTYAISSGNGSAGIYVNGGSRAVFGDGSYNIGNGITVGGGGSLTFGAAASNTSLFQIPTTNSGGNAIDTSGGGTLIFGNFTSFDFNGAMNIQANTLTLGTGIYTINGALNAASSGGTITGTGVSMMSAGPISFGAGFNSVSLSAPAAVASGTNGTVGTIALASQSSQASTVTSGASNTVVLGALYAPYAALTLSGAGNLNGGGNCLEVVVGSIALSGGGKLSTNCQALGSAASSGSVSLVQ